MSYITLKCKNCGSGMTLDTNSKTITCTHCGSTFMLADVMDEKDTAFLNKTKPEDIQTKMEIAKALKQGDTCVYQAEYKLAEEYYKKAIELDEKNYKGYFGVVRAKTSNFNRIPDTNDYLEYAKVVQKLVGDDDNVYVKSELAKLEILKKEKHEQKILQENLELKRKKNEDNKRATEKFFAEITYFLILFLTAIILVCIFMTGKGSSSSDSSNAVTYEIYTKEDLKNLVTQDKFLSSTIIIKNDIDFLNESWTPIGTESNPFTGKFYGNGYKLSNIIISDPGNEGTNYIGFFGYAKDAIISGMKLNNVSFSSDKSYSYLTRHYIGLICGNAKFSSFKRCEVLNSSSILITHQNRSLLSVGGLVGQSESSTISMCYSNATISVNVSNISSSGSKRNEYFCGGLVGYNNESNIINSYSKSDITLSLDSYSSQIYSYTAGIVGYNYTSSISNYIKKCYFAGNVSVSANSDSKKTYIAGIVSYGATQSLLSENYVLSLNDSLTINSVQVSISSCHDNFNNTSCEYISSETSFTEKILELFPASDWLNTSSLAPELK